MRAVPAFILQSSKNASMEGNEAVDTPWPHSNMMMNYEQIENDQNLEREREREREKRERESDRTEARRTFPFFIAVWCERMKEERQARAQYAR